MELEQFLRAYPRAAIAFSGGVDSAYLLYAAVKSGIQVKAYYVKTQFQPQFELEDATRLAKDVGARMQVLKMDVLGCPQIAENPGDRCYFCKKRIFQAILDAAGQDGYDVVMDGTNASDDASDRPGMRALEELRVVSPLRACALSKDAIRLRSREAGLFTHDKPAYACLATRIPTGEPITAEKLEKTERAERFLAGLGLRDLRVRMHGQNARIQVRGADLPEVIRNRERIVKELRQDYGGVWLDLEVRDEF